MKIYKRVIVAAIVAIILLVLTLLNELGAKDTTSRLIDIPEEVHVRRVIGETYRDGQRYEIIETTKITAHLRVTKQ